MVREFVVTEKSGLPEPDVVFHHSLVLSEEKKKNSTEYRQRKGPFVNTNIRERYKRNIIIIMTMAILFFYQK